MATKNRSRSGRAGRGAVLGGAGGAVVGAGAGVGREMLQGYRKLRKAKKYWIARQIIAALKNRKFVERMMKKKLKRAAKVGAAAGGVAGVTGGSGVGLLKKSALSPRLTRLTPMSSSVKGFSYDPSSQNLTVTFKSGQTYVYKKVPSTVYRSLQRNKSVGKTLHKRVKQPGYEYEKVGSMNNFMMGFVDEMNKVAARKGLKLIREMIRRGDTKGATRLATTKGVVKMPKKEMVKAPWGATIKRGPGSKIQKGRGGMMADPELGLRS